MALIFACRHCGSPACDWTCEAAAQGWLTEAGEAVGRVPPQAKPSPDQERLTAVYNALQGVAKTVLRARDAGQLMANGRTKEAHRNAMRHYMRKYRARKRAERLAALAAQAEDGGAQPAADCVPECV